MGVIKAGAAYIVSVVAGFLASASLITWRIIAEQQAVGAQYGAKDVLDSFMFNVPGLVSGGFAGVFAIALLVGFLVAAVLKRALKPLAPIAYPLAGGTAVIVALLIIGAVMAPGVGGAIPGARSPFEMALQAFAGAFGGLIFERMRPKRA